VAAVNTSQTMNQLKLAWRYL